MYAENNIYEIHACSRGQWKTLGKFNDGNEAIAEAVRMRRSHEYVGIRVTEESFQDTVGKFASRVVYDYSLEPHRRPVMVMPPAVTMSAGPFGSSVQLGMMDPTPHEETLAPAETQSFAQPLAMRLGFMLLAAVLLLMVARAA